MTKSTLEHVRTKYERALLALEADPSQGGFDDIAARYEETHRAYHDLGHIACCLTWLAWFEDQAQSLPECTLALVLHDVIYDPKAGDNEAQSARMAERVLAGAGVNEGVIERVVSAIEATASHDAIEGDAALVVDIDLSILAAPRRTFDAFGEDIRHEYAHVPEALFVAGRAGVLERFLKRRCIYRVSAVRDELETRARANLKRALSELRAAS